MKTYLKTKDFVLPEDSGLYNIIASNGVFRVRKIPASTTCSKMCEVNMGDPDLVAHKASCALHFPKIPKKIAEDAIRFFKAVYQEHYSEAIVKLMWDIENECYVIDAPPQKVSSGHVECDINPEFAVGKQIVGDIHSHGSFKCGASWTDEKDEVTDDGIHLIFGDLGSYKRWRWKDDKDSKEDQIDYSGDYVMDKCRFKLKLDGIFDLEGESPDEFLTRMKNDTSDDFPKHWMDAVEKKSYSYLGGEGYGAGYIDGYWYDEKAKTYRRKKREKTARVYVNGVPIDDDKDALKDEDNSLWNENDGNEPDWLD